MKAFAIIRQSSKREGSDSLGDQRAKAEGYAAGRGVEIVETFGTSGESGARALSKRDGLAEALERAENGEAQMLILPWRDRLDRNTKVREEVIERMDAAGVEVVTAGGERLTYATADDWERNKTEAVRDEAYVRRTRERVHENKVRRVEAGLPVGRIPRLGYRSPGGTRPLQVIESHRDAIVHAFTMRADGQSVNAIRAMLAEAGFPLSYTATQKMLASEVYTGAIVFGDLRNETAHEPIVPRRLWQRAQDCVKPRGRRAASERLLARLGVLRCGSCGAKMVVANSANGTYPTYRCPPNGACTQRVSIGAEIAERAVLAAAKEWASGHKGRAAVRKETKEAARELARLELELDAAVRAFRGVEHVEAAQERFAELQAEIETARAHHDELLATAERQLIVGAGNVDDLPVEKQRILIRGSIAKATVKPGRGDDRITIEQVPQ